MKNTKQSLKRSATKAATKPGKAKKPAKVLSTDGGSMKLFLTSHNVTLTDAIESHIVSRVQQLSHMDPRAIDARVVIAHDSTKAVQERRFKCSMRISEPGPDLFAEDHEADLYAAIDLVAKKIEQQMRKRHSKFKARNHTDAARVKREQQESAMG